MATWPVIDGDPRWEEKLDDQMTRSRTRLQKKLSSAKGEKKASFAAQLKTLREDFQREHARLAESEESGGYVVAKATMSKRAAQKLGSSVDDPPGNARDREMGRTGAPLGDVGQGHETWKPPAGEQGLSNRPDDDGTDTHNNASPLNAQEQQDDGDFEGDTEIFDQKGGDRSDRAAHSGATWERSTSGGQNKPEPRNQDEKDMGHPRNRQEDSDRLWMITPTLA